MTGGFLIAPGGECYAVDGAVTEEPLFWVPCPGTGGVTDSGLRSAKAASVTRQLPPAFVPGESITVTLLTSPSEGTAAQAIEEQVPAGWSFVGVTQGGEYDAASGKTRWGPFCDSTPRMLQYEIRPPRTAAGPAEFAGWGSYDGVSSRIAGPSALPEACRLVATPESEPGKVVLTLSGRLGARFQVEVSEDLRVWTVLTVLTNAAGQVAFSDPHGMNQRQRFYRAVLIMQP